MMDSIESILYPVPLVLRKGPLDPGLLKAAAIFIVTLPLIPCLSF